MGNLKLSSEIFSIKYFKLGCFNLAFLRESIVIEGEIYEAKVYFRLLDLNSMLIVTIRLNLFLFDRKILYIVKKGCLIKSYADNFC
jgi:hypothetical protein